MYAYLNYQQEEAGQGEQAIKAFERLTLEGRITLSDKMLTAEDLAATINYLARRGTLGVLIDYIRRYLSRSLSGPEIPEIRESLRSSWSRRHS